MKQVFTDNHWTDDLLPQPRAVGRAIKLMNTT